MLGQGGIDLPVSLAGSTMELQTKSALHWTLCVFFEGTWAGRDYFADVQVVRQLLYRTSSKPPEHHVLSTGRPKETASALGICLNAVN